MGINGDVAEALLSHVLGPNGPTEKLLNRGRLPAGWTAEYLRLVELAKAEWFAEDKWPREAVAAIHFASFYLQLRYDAWRRSAGQDCAETAKELARIRIAGELFLLGWVNYQGIFDEVDS